MTLLVLVVMRVKLNDDLKLTLRLFPSKIQLELKLKLI